MNAAHHARWPPTSEPSQSAWAISLPLGCRWPALTNPVIINQPESWYSFYRPAEGGRLSRPQWLARHPDRVPARRRVTHPSTNWARRRVTTLIETNALPLSQATTTIFTQCLLQFASVSNTHFYVPRCIILAIVSISTASSVTGALPNLCAVI